MKKYNIYIILILSFVVTSCLKEEQEYNTNLDDDATIKLIHISDQTSRSSYNFLYFKNHQIFEDAIENLANTYEAYDDNFIASYPNLSGEALTDKELEIGFDTYKPFIDFTEKYGLTHSLLDDYIKSEDIWQANEFLVEADDPDITYLDLEPEELAMLNADGVVQIGKDIFIQAQNGLVIIPDGNTDTLSSVLGSLDFSGLGPIDIDPNSLLGLDGLNFDWIPDPVSPIINCTPYQTEDRKWWNYSSTRKVKGVVRYVRDNLWGTKLKSKTKYYRRYWAFGYHWMNTRASSLTAALDGYSDTDLTSCATNAIVFDENINKKVRHNKAKAKYKYKISEIPNADYFLLNYQTLKGVHKKSNDFRREHYVY